MATVPTRVVFRADAGRAIGTGHVMRCLTLADALAAAGARCRFVTRAHDGHLGDLVRARGHELTLLPHPAAGVTAGDLAHSAWLGVDQRTDAAETAAAIAAEAPDWIVVDHYALDRRWESGLRAAGRRIMAIDDLADRVHDCDLLLDQNVIADAERRYDGLVPATCGRMIGPRFALLQPAYADLRARVGPRSGPIRRILVYFGGGDVGGITERALAGVIPLLDGSFAVDLVINGSLPYAKGVRNRVAGVPGVVLHESLPSLAPLIAAADLALGGGGATSLERCCLGVPSIVVTLAANQRPGAAELERRGLVEWLGDEAEVDSGRIGAAVAAALRAGVAEERSRRCLELLDGRGTATVAGFLLLGPSTPLTARPANADDEALLLEWANDPVAALCTPDRVCHIDWPPQVNRLLTERSLPFSEDENKSPPETDDEAAKGNPDKRAAVLKARRATAQDARLLWQWANDPDVRGSAFNAAQIPWTTHLEWLHRRLTSPDYLISIITDESDTPVGQVRFEGAHDQADVDIIVAPAFRGLGYATLVLRQGLRLLFEHSPCRVVYAWIKKENLPSQRTFSRAGFRFVGEKKMHGFEVVGYRLSRHEFF